jgi:hypothetical protein
LNNKKGQEGMEQTKHFICYFFFVDWYNVSLGINIALNRPNIEIHIPFGFFRIGVGNKFPRKFKENKVFGIVPTYD